MPSTAFKKPCIYTETDAGLMAGGICLYNKYGKNDNNNSEEKRFTGEEIYLDGPDAGKKVGDYIFFAGEWHKIEEKAPTD